MIQRYQHPFRFYFFSSLIPWGFWLIAAYLSHRADSREFDLYISVLGLLGLCGPLFVAAYYTGKDRQVLEDIGARFINITSANWSYFLFAIVLMPASIILAMAISLLFGHSHSQFIITGHATFSSGVLPVWLILVLAPALEELAWHSYGTDCLRQKYSLFATSIIFGLIWVVWHMPLALIKGYYHSNLVMEGAIYGLNFMFSIFPFVILMNWLYYKTGRNIMAAVILHVSACVFNEIFSTHPDSKIIQTILLTALAAYLLKTQREFFFSKSYRDETASGADISATAMRMAGSLS